MNISQDTSRDRVATSILGGGGGGGTVSDWILEGHKTPFLTTCNSL